MRLGTFSDATVSRTGGLSSDVLELFKNDVALQFLDCLESVTQLSLDLSLVRFCLLLEHDQQSDLLI